MAEDRLEERMHDLRGIQGIRAKSAGILPFRDAYNQYRIEQRYQDLQRLTERINGSISQEIDLTYPATVERVIFWTKKAEMMLRRSASEILKGYHGIDSPQIQRTKSIASDVRALYGFFDKFPELQDTVPHGYEQMLVNYFMYMNREKVGDEIEAVHVHIKGIIRVLDQILSDEEKQAGITEQISENLKERIFNSLLAAILAERNPIAEFIDIHEEFETAIMEIYDSALSDNIFGIAYIGMAISALESRLDHRREYQEAILTTLVKGYDTTTIDDLTIDDLLDKIRNHQYRLLNNKFSPEDPLPITTDPEELRALLWDDNDHILAESGQTVLTFEKKLQTWNALKYITFLLHKERRFVEKLLEERKQDSEEN